jgi:hypothetical protein
MNVKIGFFTEVVKETVSPPINAIKFLSTYHITDITLQRSDIFVNEFH